MLKKLALALAATATLLIFPAAARVEKLVVHGPSLEANLEGNSPDRTVFVIVPPSYDKAKKRHYPVLYFLHGFTATAERYMDEIRFGEVVEGFATENEMIVVVPDSYTRQGGSM